jgi:hypothetical protein
MDIPEFLDSSVTPASLAAKCDGLTDLQSQDIVAPYIGKWLHFRGYVAVMTGPEPLLPNVLASATLEPEDGPQPIIYCVFTKGFADLRRLKEIGIGDLVEVTGRIKEIRMLQIVLDDCSTNSVIPKAFMDLVRSKTDTAASDPPPSPNREAGPNERPKDKPPLSNEALKAWHVAFLLAYPTGSKQLAEQSAKACFPNHIVSRDRVRELFPDASMGRPKKTIV